MAVCGEPLRALSTFSIFDNGRKNERDWAIRRKSVYKDRDPQRPYAEHPEGYLRKGSCMELTPDWIVGFTDGEGCFYVGINKSKDMSLGYQVLPEFTIVQHHRDIQVLYALKKFFSTGVVRQNHGDRYCYRVRKLSGLQNIVAFFEKHSLKTKKSVDFKKFRKIILCMERGDHLTKDGLLKIVSLSETMNTSNRAKLDKIKQEIASG